MTLSSDKLLRAQVELNRAFEWTFASLIKDNYFGKPVILTIQTHGRKRKCAGWCIWDKWSDGNASYHELNIAAEHLDRTVNEIIGTVVHEACHVWNYANNVKDCNSNGGHNKHFKTAAEELGLVCAQPYDSYLHGYTSVGEDLTWKIENLFMPNKEDLGLFRLWTPPEAKESMVRVWQCQCEKPIKHRASKGKEVRLMCLECNSELEPEDDD